MGVKVGGSHIMAKITIKKLELLTATDEGRCIRQLFLLVSAGQEKIKITPVVPGRTNP